MNPDELVAQIAALRALLEAHLLKHTSFQRAIVGIEPLYKNAKQQLSEIKNAHIVLLDEFKSVSNAMKEISEKRRQLWQKFSESEGTVKKLNFQIEEKQSSLRRLQTALESSLGKLLVLEFPNAKRSRTED
jgi:chromosome segregation ATPase